QSGQVLDLMRPIVERGVVLTGYQRLVYCRNRSDNIEETINQTDSLYQVYLNDAGTGDSSENLLVSYLHFLCSNRLFGAAEQYADTLVAHYGAQRKYMDMRY